MTLLKSAPVIETLRLKLRAHRREDLQSCFSMWADPKVVQFIGGKPSTEQQTWARILNYAGLWSLLGFGYWAIEEKVSGDFVGELGFADFKRDISPSLDGVPEVGWALAAPFHDQGYATEALHAVLQWGDQNLLAPRTACIIHPDNLISIRLAEKCRFIKTQPTTYLGQPTILFSRAQF